MTDSSGGTAVINLGPEAPKTAPKRGRMVGAVVGVSAIVAASTFAFTQLRSNGEGGADSPEQVGTQLVQAIDSEDALGAIDLLLPGERETFRAPLVNLFQELGRLGVTDDGLDLNQVAGFNLEIRNPQVTVESTNVADISNVTVRGDAESIIDGKRVPIGDLLIDEAFNGERPEMDSEEKTDFDVTFATVKKGGRWYLSLFHSIAEQARGDRQIPNNGLAPVGADSPEDAVDGLLQAVSDLKVDEMIARLNPNEAAALQRYGPLFVDSAQREINDSGLSWNISDTDFAVSGEGSRRSVTIEALTFSAEVEGEQVTVRIKDGCVEASLGQEEFNSCGKEADGSAAGVLDELGLDDTDGVLSKLFEDIRTTFADAKTGGLSVDRVGGQWFVSPIGTYFDLLLGAIAAIDRDELELIIQDFRDAADSLQSQNEDDEYVTTDDGLTADDATDWTSCFSDSDPQGCFATGLANGNFDPEQIWAPFVYPECGLFDYYFEYEITTDSAETFHAKVVGAADCIIAAADADGVDLSYSSIEFLRPECYESVNPFNYEDYTTDEISAAHDCTQS